MTTSESTPLSQASQRPLQDALRQGLAVVTEMWSHAANDWVTSVHIADIDGDGDDEVLLGSRDGCVRALTRHGFPKWEYMTQQRQWLGTIYCIPNVDAIDRTRVLVGSRDFNVTALDEQGLKLWEYHTEQVVRRIRVSDINQDGRTEVLVGSEDCCVHALDCATGKLLWKFKTNGWIRFVLPIDIDGDHSIEVLVASGDKYLYILDASGNLKKKFYIGYKIHALHAVDLDGDGSMEILIGSDSKDLYAMTPDGEIKWRFHPTNRIHSIVTIDIDHDGELEIVAGSEDEHIYFLDKQGQLLWKHHLGHRIFSIHYGDINRDGIWEIIAGAADNHLRVLRVELTKDLLSRIIHHHTALGHPHTSTLDLSSRERDLLRDLLEETEPHNRHFTLVQVEQQHASHNHIGALTALLHLHDQNMQLIWKTTDIGHIRDISLNTAIGRVQKEIAVGTDEGDVKILNAEGDVLWTYAFNEQLRTIRVSDVDQDGKAEIVVGDKDGHVYALSDDGQTIKWQSQFDDWIESIWTTSSPDGNRPEIIFSSANKLLHIYTSHFSPTLSPIIMPQIVSVVVTHDLNGDGRQEIITGALDYMVRVYTRDGGVLWSYETLDRVKSIHVKDVDSDGHVEVLVGSEDRNIYVLDYQGNLKWRYQTPHRVMSITTFDINYDGRVEILVGAGNGILYILNGEGDLLWQIKANDRIRSVHALDLNGDGLVEILLGTEDHLYMLQVLNHQQIHDSIEKCWQTLLGQHSPREALYNLALQSDAVCRAFALKKLLAASSLTAEDNKRINLLLEDDGYEVRLAIAASLPILFRVRPDMLRPLLEALATARNGDVRIALINHLSDLCHCDPALGFEYLERFSRSMNPWIRRAVVRQLDRLFQNFPQEVFALLLSNFQHQAKWRMEWLDQETMRVLAHYFDAYPGSLLRGIRRLMTYEVDLPLLNMVAYCATTPVVRQTVYIFVELLLGLDESNVLERLKSRLTVLEETCSLLYGELMYWLHHEFFTLHSMHTIEEVAQYKCTLQYQQFLASPYEQDELRIHNTFNALNELNEITRVLRMYLRRDGLGDRIASLLEVTTKIDALSTDLKQVHFSWCQRPERFPDYAILHLLLTRWRVLVKAELARLRGKAELFPVLQNRVAPQEQLVGIVLNVTNKGRSPADNVVITLQPNPAYIIISPQRREFKMISTQEPVLADFTIQPFQKTLYLTFDVLYDDAEGKAKSFTYGDRMELVENKQEFQRIHNPYYTGTPIQDQNMFYGREEELALLQEDFVHSSANTVVVLYGQRRSGKSSILYKLMQASILHPHVPVHIDMQHETLDFSTTRFLYSIAKHIYREVRKQGYVLPSLQKAEFEDDPIFALDVFLDDVEVVLQERKLIILIDEFEILEDKVKKQELDSGIFVYLRSLMQHRRGMHFLLAGTHTIKDLTAEYWSVFFNIAIHRRLSRFEREAAQQLITRPVEGMLEYDPFALEKIHRLTGDQPYLIQLVCHSLVRHCNRERKNYVTINDVAVVQHMVMESGQTYFDWIWSQASTKEERAALAIIAQEGGDEGGRYVSLADIERVYRDYGLPYRRDLMLQALRKLCDGDVANVANEASRDNRFKLTVGLTRTWLRALKPLRHVISEEQLLD